LIGTAWGVRKYGRIRTLDEFSIQGLAAIVLRQVAGPVSRHFDVEFGK
jgi:hypothetical protein